MFAVLGLRRRLRGSISEVEGQIADIKAQLNRLYLGPGKTAD